MSWAINAASHRKFATTNWRSWEIRQLTSDYIRQSIFLDERDEKWNLKVETSSWEVEKWNQQFKRKIT